MSSRIYDVTAVVVNYNGGDGLLRTIRSLRAQSGIQLTVSVWDDGSTDDSIALARESGLVDQFTVSPVNTKYANRWRAQGFFEAKTDLVFITDNDAEFAPDCLFLLAQTLEEDPCIGAATPAIYDSRDRSLPYSLGSLTHFLALTIRLPADNQKLVDSTGSGITMYSKSRVQGLGSYDPEMPMGWGSDNELHQRIRLAGLRSVVNRDARLFHEFKPFSELRSYRVEGATHNRLRFICVHYSLGTIVGLLPLLVAFELFLMLFFSLKGLGARYFAGVRLFLRNFGGMRRQRRFVQSLRRCKDRDILCAGEMLIPAHAGLASGPSRYFIRLVNAALSLYWRVLTRLTPA